jgi:hypothetical protein
MLCYHLRLGDFYSRGAGEESLVSISPLLSLGKKIYSDVKISFFFWLRTIKIHKLLYKFIFVVFSIIQKKNYIKIIIERFKKKLLMC